MGFLALLSLPIQKFNSVNLFNNINNNIYSFVVFLFIKEYGRKH